MKRIEKGVLAFALSAFTTVSVGQNDRAILEESAAVCASTLGIAAIMTDADLSTMVFRRDAKWWREILVQLTDKSEAEERLREGMNELKEDYNSDKTTFDEILELSRQCSEAKIQME